MATVSGTLKVKQSAPITAVASAPGQRRVTAPVAANGQFQLQVPASSTYRVRFLSTRNGKPFVVGTVAAASHARLQVRTSHADRIELGDVGTAAQDSASGGVDCSADGEELDATGDTQDQQGEASTSDGDHDVQQDDPCGENESESGGGDS